jgi:hypothetical protein
LRQGLAGTDSGRGRVRARRLRNSSRVSNPDELPLAGPHPFPHAWKPLPFGRLRQAPLQYYVQSVIVIARAGREADRGHANPRQGGPLGAKAARPDTGGHPESTGASGAAVGRLHRPGGDLRTERMPR